jgi:uncharacterized membrane protein YagU involved in acid resistance
MDWGNIILAGVVATAVMTVLMYVGRAMGMQMDMPRMLGLMFSGPGNGSMVAVIGMMVHVMMGIVFAVGYALLFEGFGIGANWLWGGVFGAAHGVIAGMAMAMMPVMHPRMGDGEVLAAPGPFGVNYGSMVPVGIVMLHIVFGVVVGVIV